MSTRLPRRSTRSQSRDIVENGIDTDAEPVASTSSQIVARPSRKPRASTRKKQNVETIIEDELIVEDLVDASAGPSTSATANGHNVIQDQIIEKALEKEEEGAKVLSEVEPSKDLPIGIRPRSNRLRSRIIAISKKLADFAPYAAPILIALAMMLAVLLPSPNEPFARKTYVDENALQPGSASVDWGWPQVELADEIAKRVTSLAQASAAIRAAFISKELQSIGLVPYNQSYSFTVPGSQGAKYVTGINTYARLPASRGDGREAFVLSAAWKSSWDGRNDPDVEVNSRNEEEILPAYEGLAARRTNVRGLAATLVLARYLSGFGHWSKDLIFVFSDGEIDGIQAWTSSYFGRDQNNLVAEVLQCGGANIWNAVSIDYPSDSFSSIVIKHEGLQGKLPNMDVINAFTRIAQRTDAMPVTLSAASEHEHGWKPHPMGIIGDYLETVLWRDVEGAKQYLSGLLNVISQIGFLASGKPSGIHGVFHRYHVDAITIFLRPATGPYGFHHIGRAVESMTRSMSNLLERLHHSQYFYLLTSPSRFIEVGKYLPVAILFSAALFILGICIWKDEGKQGIMRQSMLINAIKAAIEEEEEYEQEDAPYALTKDSVAVTGSSTHLGDDIALVSPTSAQLSSTLTSLLVNRALKRGDLLSSTKMKSIFPLIQIQGRSITSSLRIILSAHLIGAYGYYIINRAPVDCARHGLEQCRPLRLLSAATISISLLVAWQSQRSHSRSYASILKRCEAQLPPDSLPLLSTFESSQARSLARLVQAFILMEAGMIILAISLVNFSLAFCFGLLLCIPLCACRLPQSSPISITVDTTIISGRERSSSPASNDSDLVEAITSAVATTHTLSTITRIRLLLHSAFLLLMTPFALLYLAKGASQLGCPFDSRFCAASTWLDWSFDDTLLQHHLLGTLAIPFSTLLYLPIIIAASIACLLASMN